MLSCHRVDWTTSLCQSSTVHTWTMKAIGNTQCNCATLSSSALVRNLPPPTTCPRTRSTFEEANFELLYIIAAIIAIVRNARIPANCCGEPEGDVKTTRYLTCDASIPSRNVYHESVIIGDNNLSGPLVLAARTASCSSVLEMFHDYQEETVLETRPNSQEADDPPETRITSSKDVLVWNIVRDNDVLREFYRNRRNLVLDSLYPELTPHIVVTPAEESWNDSFIPWQNRLDFQQTEYLMVSPSPVPSDACPWVEECHNHATPTEGSQTSVDIFPMARCGPTPVFSASVFNKHVDDASIERLVLCQIVRTLQKQRCKAAFFDACHVAITFRKRYDSSLDAFNAIERPYIWSDPAEPLLLLSQRLLGTTIIDSHSPFRVPHIIINAPPPQDLWIPWNNATNNPQDHGYGRYLIVPSPSVEVIGVSTECWEANSSFDFSSTSLAADPWENPQFGTIMPETPVDDVEPSLFVVQPGADVGEMADGFHCSSVLDVESTSNEEPCAPDVSSCSIFSIEEDEDGLPPFDDWYTQ